MGKVSQKISVDHIKNGHSESDFRNSPELILIPKNRTPYFEQTNSSSTGLLLNILVFKVTYIINKFTLNIISDYFESFLRKCK